MKSVPFLRLVGLLAIGLCLAAVPRPELAGALQAPTPASPRASTQEPSEPSRPVTEPGPQLPGRAAQPPTLGRPVAPTVPPGAILLAPAQVPEAGPLYDLREVARRLGGTLSQSGQSFTLELEGTRILLGAGSSAMVVGQDILTLGQAPVYEGGEEGTTATLLVPRELLERTYGALARWQLTPTPGGELLASQRQGRELPVTVDVIHLGGVSTVVLQFPERFEYRVIERVGDLEVRPRRDRFRRGGGPVGAVVDDPLVDAVLVTPEAVVLDLALGATAEGYTLENPFRLVFDVVRAPERDPALDGPDGEGRDLRPPSPRPGLRTIVIDPGHGGSESGAVGADGVQEKDLALDLARSLAAELRRRLPVKVVLTRDEDASLPLETRTAIANQNKADLFISIHLNSTYGPQAHGAETYFLSMEASDARSARSARLENSVEGGEGGGGPRERPAEDPLYDLELILWDMAQSHHLGESQRVATLIQGELNSALGLRDRGVKQAPFLVLMGAAMPAVLVELGFLSNPEEAAKLQDPAYRQDLVEALVRAISRYRATLEAEEVAPEGAGAPGEGAGSGGGGADGETGEGAGDGDGDGDGESAR